MKLSQADENVLTTLFGKEVVEKLSGALKSEDGELSLGVRLNGRVITQDDEKLLKENAVQQGKEIGSKELARELKINLDSGEKDPKIIAEKLKSSIITTLEDKYKNPQPGEREKELEEKLKAEGAKYDKLFGTHSETLTLIEEKDKAFTGLQSEIKTKERNNNILKSFPEKMKMDRNDALLITTNSFDFEDVDGKTVARSKADGQIVTTGTGQPETIDNVVKSFVEKKQWVKGTGMGGGDRSTSGKKGGKTPEEAHKFLTEKGVNPSSPEGIKEFRELTSKVEE